MSHAVRYLPGYRRDVEEVVVWYDERSGGLGVRFRGTAADTIKRVRENPYAAPAYRRGVRRVMMPVFPYGIFYRVDDDAVVVIALQHLHRDPRHIMRIVGGRR